MIEKDRHLSDDQLQSLLDDILVDAAADELNSHLEACPDCQARIQPLEKLAVQLQNLPEVRISRDLTNPVIAQLKGERQLTRGITRALAIEVLAAGALIGLLLPAARAAGWLPRFLNIRQEILAAVNIFLTQLASSWLVWGAELQLQISQQIRDIIPLTSLPLTQFSPWILIASAGGLALLINYLLLGRQPTPGRNHETH